MSTVIPESLTDRAFTVGQAEAAGLPRSRLRSKTFQQVYRGVYAPAGLQMTGSALVRAAILAIGPRDVAASNVTGLALHGACDFDDSAVHLATHRRPQRRRPGVVVHRHRFLGEFEWIDGCPVLGPARCLVDAATNHGIVPVVAWGDSLIRSGKATLDALRSFGDDNHFDGVQRFRRSVLLMSDRAESPMESVVRVMIELAGLPRPLVNHSYGEESFLARLDLSYREYKIAVEYDGRQHGLSLDQRERDVRRREQMEREGWAFIVITAAQLAYPRDVVLRIHRLLVERGYRGARPTFSQGWLAAFTRPLPRDLRSR